MGRRRVLTAIPLFLFGLVFSGVLSFLSAPQLFEDFSLAADNREIYLTLRPLNIARGLTNTTTYKAADLQWSPDKSFVSFFERVMEPAEKPYDREWALKVVNSRTWRIKTLFIGDSSTNSYHWLDERTIRVFMRGGTGVRIYRDLEVGAKDTFVAAAHRSFDFWTPIKTY